MSARQRKADQATQARPPFRPQGSGEVEAVSHPGAPMPTVLRCNLPLPNARHCRGLVGVLPGVWFKVRLLHDNEDVPEGFGATYCSNPLCRAKWLVQPSSQQEAA